MRTSESTAALFAALSAAQGELKNPAKNRTVKVRMKSGGEYTFDYATLDSILEDARPVLAKNGLALVQGLQAGEQLLLLTRLGHKSGEWLEVETPVLTVEHGPQALGSAISYARRYAVAPLLGIASEEDDDGNGASGNSSDRHDRAKPPARPHETARHAPAGRMADNDDAEAGLEALAHAETASDLARIAAALMPTLTGEWKARAVKIFNTRNEELRGAAPADTGHAASPHLNPTPWEVREDGSVHCKQHPKYPLKTKEGKSAKGPWKRYFCTAKDESTESGYCSTGGFENEIFPT